MKDLQSEPDGLQFFSRPLRPSNVHLLIKHLERQLELDEKFKRRQLTHDLELFLARERSQLLLSISSLLSSTQRTEPDTSTDDHESPNHKESLLVLHKMEDTMGVDAQALDAFQPGMRNAREKLQWASTHVTTVPEDIVDSLSRIFGVYIPAIHGENPQRALGRLLQEIVTELGDISLLDWVGRCSEFNSCLAADIARPFAAKTCECKIARAIFSLLESLSPARFAHRRLHLPCFVFPLTEIRRQRGPAQDTPCTYEVKADRLWDLLIASDQTLVQFSRARPTRQTFLLVRPWDRRLLELPDFADDADLESLGDWCEPESPLSHQDYLVEKKKIG
ncbi:hypothetical protein F4604DRAFT_1953445 [Suillus subluteus]|nr:hypothetical protein F4604DRAFT_1953445 [Suillus subluteus]